MSASPETTCLTVLNFLLQIVFAPILWAQAGLRKAYTDGLIPSVFLYKAIHK